MNRASLTVALVVSACGGMLASAQPATGQTVITGTVRSKDGKPLAGLAMLEKGEIHNNVWERGGLVDPQGHFRIQVAAGGQYGLHVYSSGYIYAPQAIKVEPGKTLEVNVTLLPEPTRANDPVIKKVGFFPYQARQGKVTYVKMDVADLNGILGPQVLALNATTGRAFAMEPPRRVSNLKANYPNGVYQIEVDTAQRPINPRDWHFVVANHQCHTTDVLSYPHEPKPPQVVK